LKKDLFQLQKLKKSLKVILEKCCNNLQSVESWELAHIPQNVLFRVFKRGVSVSESKSEIKNMFLDEIIETQNELTENVKK
jgi:hypothetical protein